MRVGLMVVAIALSGCVASPLKHNAPELPAVFPAGEGQDCPGHWHATFALFVPDGTGNATWVDFSAPLAPDGGPYYDVDGMMDHNVSPYMLQDPWAPVDVRWLAANQLHFGGEEYDGGCVSVSEALRVLDAGSDGDSITLWGGHQQTGKAGTHASAEFPLQWLLQSPVGDEWHWRVVAWKELRTHQLQDGESLVGIMGRLEGYSLDMVLENIPVPEGDGRLTTAEKEARIICAGEHRIASFAVWTKVGDDQSLSPLDWAAVRTGDGRPYYDYDIALEGEGARSFSPALHMHQVRYDPQGIGGKQWHMEEPGTCVTVHEALAAVDVMIVNGGIRVDQPLLDAPHRSETNFGYDAQGFRALTAWLRPGRDASWQAVAYEELLERILRDGDSVAFALGDAASLDDQIKASVPVPEVHDVPAGRVWH